MAKLDLQKAYVAVFRGGADDNQRQVVLADLASFSGFFSVSPDGADLNEANGKRKVFGRVLEHIAMPEVERDALLQAARRETIVDSFEEEF